MTEPVDVLWTSGWDSTYRVARLLLVERRAVQPWYILDRHRRSSNREIDTQRKIREALITKDPTVSDRLRPTIIRPLEKVPPNHNITEKWRILHTQGFLGRQYDWLARQADAEDITLELSVHRDDTAHAYLEGSVVADSDGVFRLKEGIEDALTLFQRFRLPLLDMTKLQMQEQAEQDDFSDIMEMTWFCSTPLLNGRPCGYCNPCKYTRNEGLARRVPSPSLTSGLQYSLLKNMARVRSRLRRLR